MKVNNIKQGKITDLSQRNDVDRKRAAGRKESGSSREVAGKDVSETSRLISNARVEADKISDVRKDRVAEVRQKLADGYYDSEEVKETLARKLALHIKQILNR